MAGLKMSEYPPQYTPREVRAAAAGLSTTPQVTGPKPPPQLADAMFGPAPPENPYYAGPTLPGAGIASRINANTVQPALEKIRSGLPTWNDVVDGSRRLAVGAINALKAPVEAVTGTQTPDLTVDQYRRATSGYRGVPAAAPADAYENMRRGLAARAESDRINAERGAAASPVIDSGLTIQSALPEPVPQTPPPQQLPVMPIGTPGATGYAPPQQMRGIPQVDLPDMPAVGFQTRTVRMVDPETKEVTYENVTVPVDNSPEALRFAAQKAGLGLQAARLGYEMDRNTANDQWGRMKDLVGAQLQLSGERRAQADQYAQNMQRSVEQLGQALALKDLQATGRYAAVEQDGSPNIGHYNRQALQVLTNNGYALRAGGMGNFFESGQLTPDQVGVLGQATIPQRTEKKYFGLFGNQVVPPVLRLPAAQNPAVQYINDVPVDTQLLQQQFGVSPEELAQLPAGEFAALAEKVGAAGLPGRRIATSAMR